MSYNPGKEAVEGIKARAFVADAKGSWRIDGTTIPPYEIIYALNLIAAQLNAAAKMHKGDRNFQKGMIKTAQRPSYLAFYVDAIHKHSLTTSS